MFSILQWSIWKIQKKIKRKPNVINWRVLKVKLTIWGHFRDWKVFYFRGYDWHTISVYLIDILLKRISVLIVFLAFWFSLKNWSVSLVFANNGFGCWVINGKKFGWAVNGEPMFENHFQEFHSILSKFMSTW